MNGEIVSKGSEQSVKLTLVIENIDEFTDDSPWTVKDEAFKDRAALEIGECLECGLSGDPNEVRIINLDGINAKTNISWVGLEECSVWISREILFYKDDYRIRLLINAPFNKIVDENPKYFKNNEVCGYKTYGENGVIDLNNDIILGNISGALRDWWQISNQILSTFKFLN